MYLIPKKNHWILFCCLFVLCCNKEITQLGNFQNIGKGPKEFLLLFLQWIFFFCSFSNPGEKKAQAICILRVTYRTAVSFTSVMNIMPSVICDLDFGFCYFFTSFSSVLKGCNSSVSAMKSVLPVTVFKWRSL